MSGACPRTGKIPHVSKAAAVAHIEALERAGRGSPDMSVYRCGDHWHIGHDARRFAKRIRRSIAAGRGKATLYARNRRRSR
ncbi:MAG: hypothetical protein JWO46_741 [Nocardioidaceae bacterium]|nr:hypothetical protein [Nocardioidaceae bacterium]